MSYKRVMRPPGELNNTTCTSTGELGTSSVVVDRAVSVYFDGSD